MLFKVGKKAMEYSDVEQTQDMLNEMHTAEPERQQEIIRHVFSGDDGTNRIKIAQLLVSFQNREWDCDDDGLVANHKPLLSTMMGMSVADIDTSFKKTVMVNLCLNEKIKSSDLGAICNAAPDAECTEILSAILKTPKISSEFKKKAMETLISPPNNMAASELYDICKAAPEAQRTDMLTALMQHKKVGSKLKTQVMVDLASSPQEITASDLYKMYEKVPEAQRTVILKDMICDRRVSMKLTHDTLYKIIDSNTITASEVSNLFNPSTLEQRNTILAPILQDNHFTPEYRRDVLVGVCSSKSNAIKREDFSYICNKLSEDDRKIILTGVIQSVGVDMGLKQKALTQLTSARPIQMNDLSNLCNNLPQTQSEEVLSVIMQSTSIDVPLKKVVIEELASPTNKVIGQDVIYKLCNESPEEQRTEILKAVMQSDNMNIECKKQVIGQLVSSPDTITAFDVSKICGALPEEQRQEILRGNDQVNLICNTVKTYNVIDSLNNEYGELLEEAGVELGDELGDVNKISDSFLFDKTPLSDKANTKACTEYNQKALGAFETIQTQLKTHSNKQSKFTKVIEYLEDAIYSLRNQFRGQDKPLLVSKKQKYKNMNTAITKAKTSFVALEGKRKKVAQTRQVGLD